MCFYLIFEFQSMLLFKTKTISCSKTSMKKHFALLFKSCFYSKCALLYSCIIQNYFYIISECLCDTMGASLTSCDSKGSCECISNDIVGEKCTNCKDGLFDFPLCKGI